MKPAPEWLLKQNFTIGQNDASGSKVTNQKREPKLTIRTFRRKRAIFCLTKTSSHILEDIRLDISKFSKTFQKARRLSSKMGPTSLIPRRTSFSSEKKLRNFSRFAGNQQNENEPERNSVEPSPAMDQDILSQAENSELFARSIRSLSEKAGRV